MAKLKEGDQAPEFTALTDEGQALSLKDFRGKKNIVLYFYPKDDTPGCTVEACGFRDAVKKIEDQSAVVLGVSPDSVQSHQKFIQKFSLPFKLLSDEQKKICRDYGVWVKKNMYGKEYFGVARTTFLIDKKGRIAKIFEKVKPQAHQEEVLSTLKQIG